MKVNTRHVTYAELVEESPEMPVSNSVFLPATLLLDLEKNESFLEDLES